jgi:hypothetical protein
MRFDWKRVGAAFGFQIGCILFGVGYITIGLSVGLWFFIMSGFLMAIIVSLVFGRKE